MRSIRHSLAFLTSAVLLTGTVPNMDLQTAERYLSVAEFANQANQNVHRSDACFAVLRYSKTESQFYRDGEPVGETWAGVRVSETGKLVMPASDGGVYATEAEACAALGCEITEENGEIVCISPFQTARLIVKSRSRVDSHGGAETAEGYKNLHVLQYETIEDAYAAYQAFQADAAVEYVVPDRLYCTAADETGIPLAEKSDAVNAIGAEQYCQALWARSDTLPEIITAVVDTGISAEHAWFENRIAAGGVGFVSDSSGTIEDVYGHGTHCAGIIAQSTPDAVKILPIKVISDDGFGSSFDVYCGVMYAVEQGADVISVSLGGPGDDMLLREAVRAADAAGAACCVAAGNNSADARYYSPANCDAAITISAVGRSTGSEPFSFARFSNYGAHVDFCAPGVGIVSAVPDGVHARMPMSGTSMATPFAAAAFADLRVCDPALTVAEMYEYLKANAIDLGAAGYDAEYGWGMVHLGELPSAHGAAGISISAAQTEDAASVTLTIQCSDVNADLYYTTDGSLPTAENGIRYTDPIVLTASAYVRAAAFSGDVQLAAAEQRVCIGDMEAVNPYVIADGVLQQYLGVKQAVDLTFFDGILHEIGADAFAGSGVSKVILPPSVTVIGDRAFASSGLRVCEGSGVISVGDSAFAENPFLSDLQLGSLGHIGRGAFMNCSLVTTAPVFSAQLTEIAEDAFYGCSSLTKVQWEQASLKTVGARAFAFAPCTDRVQLADIAEIGANAFAGSEIYTLELGSSLTNLGDYALCGIKSLQVLRADGLRTIGAHALDTGSDLFKARISWADITSVGAYGLCGYAFADPVEFSALTEIGAGAFAGCTGAAVTLPAVHAAESASLGGAACVLKLPNAVSLRGGAATDFACTHSEKWIFGEQLSAVAEDALGDHAAARFAYVAAPADSPLKACAEGQGVRFLAAPCLYAETTECIAEQNTQMELSVEAVTLADASEIRWYSVNAQGDEILIGTGDTLNVLSAVIGSYRYRAALYDDEIRISAKDFSVTVQRGEKVHSYTEADLCSDGETLLIDCAAYSDFTYVFTARQTAAYTFYMGGLEDYACTLYRADGSIISKIGLGEQKQLEAENTYVLSFSRMTGASENEWNGYGLVRVSADAATNSTYISDESMLSVQKQTPMIFSRFGSVIQDAAFSLDIDGELLTEHEDYLLLPYRQTGIVNGQKQVKRSLVFLGAYRSDTPVKISADAVWVEDTIAAETAKTLPDSDSSRCTAYVIKPKESGAYTAYLDYTDAWWKALNVSNVRESLMDNAAALQICDASMQPLNILEHADDALQPAYVSANLSAGEKYYLCVNHAVTAAQLHLTAQSAHVLPTLSCTALSGADANHPQFSIADLQAGKDYTVQQMQTSDAVYTVMRGIGEYQGSVVKRTPFSAVLTEDVPIQLSRTSGSDSTTFTCTFTPQETADYQFLLHKNTCETMRGENPYNVCSLAVDAEGAETVRGDDETLVLTVSLTAGECCSVTVSDLLYARELLVTRKTMLCNADFTIAESELVYDGGSVFVTAALKFDGKTLIEHEDYELTYYHAEGSGLLCVKAEGIGEYAGVQYRFVPMLLPLTTLNAPVKIDAGAQKTTFSFTPSEDGEYSFITYASQDVLDGICHAESYTEPTHTGRITLGVYAGSKEISDGGSHQVRTLGAGYESVCALKLQKGQRYHVVVEDERFNADNSQSMSLYVTYGKTHVSALNIRAPQVIDSVYDVFVTVRDGDVPLSEGTDYTISYQDYHGGPYVTVRVRGIGAYCGEVLLMMENRNAKGTLCERIEPEQPVCVPHDDAEHSFKLFVPADMRLIVDIISGRGAEVQAELVSLYGDRYYLDSETAAEITAGEYDVSVTTESSPALCKAPIVFSLAVEAESICDADIRVNDALYDGAVKIPQIEANLGEGMLMQGKDFEVLTTGEPKEVGRYSICIRGIGRYFGECYRSFCILPPFADSRFPTLTEGAVSAEITQGGQPVYYCWTPTKSMYYLTSRDILNKQVCIYRENGEKLAEICGQEYTAESVCVEAGKTYYVGASYYGLSQVGTLHFSLMPNIGSLEECSVTLEEQYVYQAGKIPAFEITDGEKTLCENVDYTVDFAAGMTHLGRAELLVRGIGSYAGELLLTYYNAPATPYESADPQSTSDQQPQTERMTLESKSVAMRGNSGTMTVFSYTADADGEYYLTLPDTECDEITSFVYDGEDVLLPFGTTSVRLNAGESCTISCVTNFCLHREVSGEDWYGVCISAFAPAHEITVNGIAYRVSELGAEVIGLSSDKTGIYLPETVTDAETGVTYQVIGIDAAAFGAYAESHTIYGEKGGLIERFCLENGYCFAQLDAGGDDITGESVTDIDDVLTLVRCIGEQAGMVLNGTAAQKADINGDGLLTIVDALLLLSELHLPV